MNALAGGLLIGFGYVLGYFAGLWVGVHQDREP